MNEENENKLIEISARWQWMVDLLEGEQVSDFALSFWEVRKLADKLEELKMLEGKL